MKYGNSPNRLFDNRQKSVIPDESCHFFLGEMRSGIQAGQV